METEDENCRVFGCPEYDASGEKILTTCSGKFSAMKMDIRVYRMQPGGNRNFLFPGEECAFLLLRGTVVIGFCGEEKTVSRENVFAAGPWCLHVCGGTPVHLASREESEILVQRTANERTFPAKLYAPDDAPRHDSCRDEFGGTAVRRVSTIFDHETAPYSNMVLGEVLNDRGNWSGYPPHRHPQPEVYYFLFDRPEGFGASFVGDRVFKSTNGSFSAIPGGELHPQAAAPGFQMYTCWMIRHLPGNPWNQTDRCEDEHYRWLHEAHFQKRG